ncbi:MAG: hypothetical protein D6730_06445 [Bacteroidetes bacterium]|nr:MAG: hypothetical protein D6730_06445 [Bacteroidota bacterium]
MAILLAAGVYYFNKIAQARGHVEATVGELESLMKQLLQNLYSLRESVTAGQAEGQTAELLDLLPPMINDDSQAGLKDSIEALSEARAQLILLETKLEEQAGATGPAGSMEIKAEVRRLLSHYESPLQDRLAHYQRRLTAYHQILERFPTGILAAMLNLEKLPALT